MNTKVIAIANNKGGSGKTTSSGVMGQLLALLGKKVLLIDGDESGNLSLLLNQHDDDPQEVIDGLIPGERKNIHELFKYRYSTYDDVRQCIYSTQIPNLDIIPSSKRHSKTQTILFMNSAKNNNVILKRAIKCIKDDYDFILIDNAPGQDILTVNTFFACDLLLIPVRSEMYSYKGVLETIDSILTIGEEHDLDINLCGVFESQADARTDNFKILSSQYTDLLGEKYLPHVRKDVKLAELNTTFCPISTFMLGPKSNRSGAILDYMQLILNLNILDTDTFDKLTKLRDALLNDATPNEIKEVLVHG